jgi:hypothetical protein
MKIPPSFVSREIAMQDAKSVVKTDRDWFE